MVDRTSVEGVSVAQNVFRDITTGVETKAAQIGLYAAEDLCGDVMQSAAFLELLGYCELLSMGSPDNSRGTV